MGKARRRLADGPTLSSVEGAAIREVESCPACRGPLEPERHCPLCRLWVGRPPRRECPVRGHGVVDTDGACCHCRNWPFGKLTFVRVGPDEVGAWRELGDVRQRPVVPALIQRELDALFGPGWREDADRAEARALADDRDR